MARKRRRRYEMKTMDQIDMTPLLDLTFLLLIVFMISMPLMEYGTKIEPPAMNSDELPLDNIKSVSITEAGTIMFGNQAVTREELVGKKKNKEIVEPRQLCIYLINEMLNIPLTAIGALLGGRDHTTIMHARDKIGNQVKINPHVRTLVNDIKSRLLKY